MMNMDLDRLRRMCRKLVARPAGWRRLDELSAPATSWLLVWLPVVAGVGALGLLAPARAAEATYSAPDIAVIEVQSDVALRSYRLRRADSIALYAERFRIGFDRASMIYDAAIAERVEPELAFRLVRVESSFRHRAIGPRGSVGLTQLQPRTAAWLDPTVTAERLFDAETNLTIGFRYLRMLLDRYDDTRMALLAYNRGPGTVAALLAVGQDPANGYARRVLGEPVAVLASGQLPAAGADH